jgi:hypothetical protein
MLKPYKGGDDLLHALHMLDIVRKHQRLLDVEIHPAKFSLTGWGLSKYFEPMSVPWIHGEGGETVLGLLAKGAPQPDIKLSMQVSLNETSYLPGANIIVALNKFAVLANSIIQKFEVP